MLLSMALGGALALVAALIGVKEFADARARLTAQQAADAADEVEVLQKTASSLELLSQYAAAVYEPLDPHDPDALVELSGRLLPLVPQAFSMVWAPAVPESRMPAMLAAIGRAGPVTPPADMPTVALAPDEPRLLVYDIHPRTEVNLRSRGLVLNELAMPAAALREAVAQRAVRATAPINLVQLPGVPALVVYGPVLGRGGQLIGALGFSYRFDAIFAAPRTAGLALQVTDAGSPAFGPVFRSGAVDPARALRKDVAFAGRSYLVEASFAAAPEEAALRQGLLAFLLGLACALAVGAVAHQLAAGNQRLEASLAAQRAAEGRLRIVLGELNHRIGNLLGLVQGVARQTFTPGREPAESMQLFEGRLAALGHSGRFAAAQQATTLDALARGVLEGFGGRFALDGPPLPLGPASSQFLGLALHELATNATKHGALARAGGTVTLTWRTEGGAFELLWRESGGAAAPDLGRRKGFGSRLLTQLVPAQLSGAATREAGSDGFLYRLSAPAAALAK